MKLKILILLTFFVQIANAQDYFEVFSFSQKYFPSANFPGTDKTSTNNDFNLDATFAFKSKNKETYLLGIFLESFNTKITPKDIDRNIFTLGLKIGINTEINEKWNVSIIGLPKLASDLYDVSWDDYQYGMVALAKIKKSNGLNYRFGIYYNDDLFGTNIVPLLGIYRKSESTKFSVNATLPIHADLNYQLGKSIYVGARFNATVKSYKIGKDVFDGRMVYLHKNNNEVKLYIQSRIGSNFIIELHGGYTIAREYELYYLGDKMDADLTLLKIGDNRNQLNKTFEDGFVQEFKLIYKVDLSQ